MSTLATTCRCDPWAKGKLIGQKAPLQPKDFRAIRVRLQMSIGSACVVQSGLRKHNSWRRPGGLRGRDVCHGNYVESRAMVMQRKTQRPDQFEITATTREEVDAWNHHAMLNSEAPLFPSRLRGSPHISTRQGARILKGCSDSCWATLLSPRRQHADLADHFSAFFLRFTPLFKTHEWA